MEDKLKYKCPKYMFSKTEHTQKTFIALYNILKKALHID